MMHSFKITSNPEVAALIEKHGTNDALFILNLTYFTDIPLTEVGGSSYDAMNTGVRKIIPGLSGQPGLTRSEFIVLSFWADHLGALKVPFLIDHAHTIICARAHRNLTSEFDVRFIRHAASCIEDDLANSDRVLSEYTTKDYGAILRLAYQSRLSEGYRRMKAQGLLDEDVSLDSIYENMLKPYIETAALRETKIKKYQTEKTLHDVEMSIGFAEGNKRFLTKFLRICEERIQMLNGKRETLKKETEPKPEDTWPGA
ncbi:hypothetical protein FAUST_2918 [Fusarium austroamericanum]|uniref:Uncharacterized protein n=1 Tax=Fusarium austroamericanum TaxID=282268 RepID=A0AAN6C601_FUSAU|nr:hypothetical protein FAUST_2918 [Fusarium austroamericanum]